MGTPLPQLDIRQQIIKAKNKIIIISPIAIVVAYMLQYIALAILPRGWPMMWALAHGAKSRQVSEVDVLGHLSCLPRRINTKVQPYIHIYIYIYPYMYIYIDILYINLLLLYYALNS